MTAVELTSDQKAMLTEFEELFADRYSASDAEYMEAVGREECVVPVVSPWYQKNAGGSRDDGPRSRKRHHDHSFHQDNRYRHSHQSYNNRY